MDAPEHFFPPLVSGDFLVTFDSRDLRDLFAIFLLDLLGLLNMNLWLKFYFDSF